MFGFMFQLSFSHFNVVLDVKIMKLKIVARGLPYISNYLAAVPNRLGN